MNHERHSGQLELWSLLELQKLSPKLHSALEDSDNTLVVSAASAWEIATKWRLGKLSTVSLACGPCRTEIPSITCCPP